MASVGLERDTDRNVDGWMDELNQGRLSRGGSA